MNMIRFFLAGLFQLLAVVIVCAQSRPAIHTDPGSPELQALAAPAVIDESPYGCGPLREPGKTYYVAIRGDDRADGTSWATAWRHVHYGIGRLQAGESLVIGEGLYIEPPIGMNVKKPQTGLPGRPITIKAAPRQRVIVSGGQRPELARTDGTRFTCQAACTLDKGQAAVWETDTQILLQQAARPEMVEEIPGTWCYDAEQKRIFAHFSDSRGPEAHELAVCPGKTSVSNFRRGDACGLDLRASYVRVQGISFCNHHTGVVIQGNAASAGKGPRAYRGGDHVTIEDCSFSSSCFSGLLLFAGARWNLVRNNYGALNGARGSLLVNHGDAEDNLFIGNRLDPSGPTLREGQWGFHYGISTYGQGGSRNHLLDNVMNDTHSFRSKFMAKEMIIQGNIMLGGCSTVPVTYYALKYRPQDRLIFRNNVLLGPVATNFQPMPPCGPAGNWCDPFKAFVNNFAPQAKDRQASIQAARFADPAYLDYRLQAGSALRKAGLGGHDVGLPFASRARVFYVSAEGSDANPGDSAARPLGTLARAAAMLKPGDTLYVLPGVYVEPLALSRAGATDRPITIRAFGRGEVVLRSVVVDESRVALEAFTISNAEGDGVAVARGKLRLSDCVVRACRGCGVKATAGAGLVVQHCTLTGNGTGLKLEEGCQDAVLRDSVFAGNRQATALAGGTQARFLASHNCYWGGQLDGPRIEAETGSVIGDPLFADAASGDLRLHWDSPAAHRAPFGRPAGARAALVRTPEIEQVQVASVCDRAAVVIWRTPQDDTTGSVSWRRKGQAAWRSVPHAVLGTVHGAGLTGLEPRTSYEFRIDVKGRRGGTACSGGHTLTTTDRPHDPATYHVSPSGDDGADGRTRASAWKTLRRASFAVGAGDTVLIAPGVYQHPIAPLRGGTPDRPVTFRRQGAGDAVIDAAEVLAPLVDIDAKDFVTVDGLIFDNLPPEGHSGVVRAEHCRAFALLNCRIGYKKGHSGFGNGVNLYACTQARIEGNVIWGTRYHFVLNQCTDALIKNNTVARGQVFSTHFTGKHDGCRLVNNIFYYPTSVPNAGVAISYPTKELRLTSDHNLFGPMVERTHVAYVYRSSVLDLIVRGSSLQQWQQESGQDLHSVQADPLFVAPQTGDFRLRPNSPALKAGEGGAHLGACGPAETVTKPAR